MTVMDFPKLLTVNEAAELTGFQRQTLDKWRCNGDQHGPPFVKLGRTVKYRLDELMAWLEAGQHSAGGSVDGD